MVGIFVGVIVGIVGIFWTAMPPQADLFFRTAKPKSKPFKISDGGGLYMQVEPHGSKLWRLAALTAPLCPTMPTGPSSGGGSSANMVEKLRMAPVPKFASP